jgi:hypothetical protein
VEDVPANESRQNYHQTNAQVQIVILDVFGLLDIFQKHYNQRKLESETKITMRHDVQSFLLPHFNVSLLNLSLKILLQLQRKLVLLLFLVYFFSQSI